MITFRLVLYAFLIVFLVIFAYYNLNTVVFRLFELSIEAPLFLLLLSAFGLGLITALGYSQLKGATLSNFAGALREGLRHFGLGYYKKAESRLSRLSDREEILPLLWEILKREKRAISVDLNRYEEGIAETLLAESLWKEDIDRAIDLLEIALGKNFSNLRARKMLRSLYFLKGHIEKSLEIQKTIIRDSEKQDRDREKMIYTEILAFQEQESLPKEIEKARDIHLIATSLILEKGKGKVVKQALKNAFARGLQDDLVLLLLEKNLITADVLEVIGEREEDISADTLALLYLSIGRVERAKELEDRLSEPIKLIVREAQERGDLLREMVKAIKLWKCSFCGVEYNNYSPICCNCLEWASITTKGGFRDACRFRQENDQA